MIKHEASLEPTVVGGMDQRVGPMETVPAESDRTLSAGSTRELATLLRQRLRAAGGFIAVAYLVFLMFSLFSSGAGYRMLAWSLLLRGLVGAALWGLLSTQLVFTHRQLRRIEWAFFGFSALLIWIAQYRVNIQLVEQGDLLTMVAIEKNGVLRMWMLMLIYGAFIPNHPRRTAVMVLSMSFGFVVTFGLVLLQQFSVGDSHDILASEMLLGSNTLFLLVGASLAIYSAHVLHDLRNELQEARQLGQYRLLKKLDAGGMGEVYLAEHQLLKRPCAIKLINAQLNRNATAIARFEREVRAAAMLSHPNTIEIYDYGIADDGTFYYVMELLPGLSLADLVSQNGPLPPGRVVYLLRQVCGSLAEAHQRGLVHRDLKPGNIFAATLGGQCDVAKVLDFGLVKQEQQHDGKQLTAEYTVSGTPAYMSPEQARGDRELDGRSDLYSLGCVMYYLLTGQPPFQSDNPMSLLIAQATDPVRPPTELSPEVPGDVEAIILKCLAKKPGDRYADAADLSRALSACSCAGQWDQLAAEAWWKSQSAEKSGV